MDSISEIVFLNVYGAPELIPPRFLAPVLFKNPALGSINIKKFGLVTVQREA
jgi:hypothetical protein